ncbi:zinc transporter ZntB [Indioceanicola profundi]|uniref:zinc transporter ZntB n=1 Tax=Indioceanicola profundi TaxID=2220096 RepID=UPI000E6AAA8C|nr:zinc transporter ZntB [Indioceanicola profundi]
MTTHQSNDPITPDGPLIHGHMLDGRGGGRRLGWAEARLAEPAEGEVLWLHLDRKVQETMDWLERESGIPELAVEALTAEETRPRLVKVAGGMVLILRGVNLNPGAEPEDMISLRIWVQDRRIVTVRLRRLLAVAQVRDAIAAGHGPADPGDLIVMLAESMTEMMEPIILEMEEVLDSVADPDADELPRTTRVRLAGLRRQAAILRRYIAPQRDALARLAADDSSPLSEGERLRLREVADDVTRYVEALNATWERGAVLQDEVANRLTEQLNSRLYLMSLMAGMFLPLTFVTGLLGINVGGIPGAESGNAFLIVCGLLGLFALLQLALLRWLKWI